MTKLTCSYFLASRTLLLDERIFKQIEIKNIRKSKYTQKTFRSLYIRDVLFMTINIIKPSSTVSDNL